MSGGLFVDAMIEDVHVKLLPIVQVHDATEYFPLGNCELVVALKRARTHTHIHTHIKSETLRTSTQAGLSSPV